MSERDSNGESGVSQDLPRYVVQDDGRCKVVIHFDATSDAPSLAYVTGYRKRWVLFGRTISRTEQYAGRKLMWCDSEGLCDSETLAKLGMWWSLAASAWLRSQKDKESGNVL